IRNLQAQHDIVSLLNVGPTYGRKDLETELTQLKDTITTLRIQNDGFKVTNATQKTEISKLMAKDVGNKSSGTTTPTKPKVLAPGMYAIGHKYIIPHRRTNRETPIPMFRKKHVTFKEPPKPSLRVTKKPVAPEGKKANVVVHLSTGIKSATEASKTASKNHAWIYRKLSAKSTIGEKVKDHPRNLNKQNRVDSQLNAKRLATPNRQTTKKVWKQKVVAHAKPQWMPTGRHFTLYDSYPLTRILDPMEEPLELSSSVSSSSNVTMLSRREVVYDADQTHTQLVISNMFGVIT
nr:hypothetical protein [Tanacetum cinerariifolium]